MKDNVDTSKNVSLSLPIGALATVLLLAFAGAAYAFMQRDTESSNGGSSRGRGSMRRKIGLMTLVTIIENDTSRKLLVAVLRAMARRS